MRHYDRRRRCGLASCCCRPPRQAQAPATPAAQTPVREITKIAGEVYRFRNNIHFSVFAVTPPASSPPTRSMPRRRAARRTETQKRWPTGRSGSWSIATITPITSRAAKCWADTATLVVADDDAKAAIVGEQRPTAVAAGHVLRDQRDHRAGGGTVLELILWRAQPLRTTRWSCASPGADALRRRLHAGEVVAFRDLPDAYLDDWIELAAPSRSAGVRHLGAGQSARSAPRPTSRPSATTWKICAARCWLRRVPARRRGDQDGRRPLQVEGLGGYERMGQLSFGAVYRLVQANRRPNCGLRAGKRAA